MFLQPEDLDLQSGPMWHGTLIGWVRTIDSLVTKIPVVSEMFCGVKFIQNNITFLLYSVYFPTSGQDEDFLEIICKLNMDINEQKRIIQS